MLKTFRVFAATTFMVACTGIAPVVHAQKTNPDFGDDKSRWAKDGECDDRRFAGPGMTDAPFLDSDVGHDASDCRNAWRSGDVQLSGSAVRTVAATPEFGNDDSEWAEDGECDDPRFTGEGMTGTDLLEDDILHDATDCNAAWERGELKLAGVESDGAPDFGDDDGDWSEDGECDDPRFAGKGMTDTSLIAADILHDATDCEAAWKNGEITLR